jgi:general secretion pathway protein F
MRVELEAVTGRGAPVSLRVDAGSVDEARAIAAQRGYVVLAAIGPPAPLARRRWTRRAGLDVGLFVQQLRELLCAGLSVVESLDTLRRGSSGPAAAAIEALERRLREGRSLSLALEEDRAFPELLVALVRASELTSDLPRTLGRWLDHDKELGAVRHRLLSTAIYPLLLAVVGGVVLLFLLFFVMPRFARVFEGMNGELPWSARAIVEWAAFLRGGAAWWLGPGCALLVAAGAGALAMPEWRAAALRRVLRWNPLRARLRSHFLARWYRAVGMLVSGGIPLASALALASGVLPTALRRSGAAVEEGVRRGLSPAEAHAQAGMTTPVAEQLLLAGERTGDLGAVLSRIAQFHEAETARWLERSMRALEPIVMVLVGAGVGIVVVLMYLPIFELASAIR